MPKLPKLYRCSVFKPTHDDWYPPYIIKDHLGKDKDGWFVIVTMLEYCNNYGWKVCVWGADDCGMELEFDKNSRRRCSEVFQQVIEQEYVNRGYLERLGFYPA